MIHLVTKSDTEKSRSVRRELELLEMMVKSPNGIDGPLRQALGAAVTSQGKLASFSCQQEGIVAMALNTHKAISDASLDGGYEALDQLRKAVLLSLKQTQIKKEKSGRGTIEWYKSELESKNRRLAQIVDEVALMSQHLDELLTLAHDMAEGAGKLAVFQKRSGELFAKFRRAWRQ